MSALGCSIDRAGKAGGTPIKYPGGYVPSWVSQMPPAGLAGPLEVPRPVRPALSLPECLSQVWHLYHRSSAPLSGESERVPTCRGWNPSESPKILADPKAGHGPLCPRPSARVCTSPNMLSVKSHEHAMTNPCVTVIHPFTSLADNSQMRPTLAITRLHE